MWRKNGSHQSHAFSKIAFKLFSWLAQPPCFSFSRSISTILVLFLIIFLNIRRPRRISLKSCPFSRRFMLLAWCYPLKLFPVVQFFFIHPEYFRSCFPSRSSGGHLFGIFLRSKFSNSFSDYSKILAPSFVSIFFRCFVQVFFNQFVISSFSCL